MSFECIQCGKCCRWPGFVWLTDEDIKRLADNLSNGDVIDFFDTYVTLMGPWGGKFKPVLNDKPDTNECIYLGKDNKCEIYDIRPKQCKDYPKEYDPECPGFKDKKEQRMMIGNAEKLVKDVMKKFSSDKDFEKEVTSNLYQGLKKEASEKVIENAMNDGIGNFLTDRKVKVASLDDLFAFDRVGDETLIHKSTRDLWTIEADDGGDVHITRLFESGKPVKG